MEFLLLLILSFESGAFEFELIVELLQLLASGPDRFFVLALLESLGSHRQEEQAE